MSIGPLGGLAASSAGSPFAQPKGSEVDRAQQDSSAQQRKIQTDQKAESASGIGQTDGENHQAGERDADGRRLWEKTADKKEGQTAPEEGQASRTPAGKDPSGQSGSLLDLSG